MNAIEYKELRIPQPDKINADLLDDEIRAALGDKYISLSTGEEIIVRAAKSATPDDAQAMEKVVQQHQPNKLSKRQQAALDYDATRARLEALDLKKLNPADTADCLADMRTMLIALDDFRKQFTNHD